jgi:hypothetical protein
VTIFEHEPRPYRQHTVVALLSAALYCVSSGTLTAQELAAETVPGLIGDSARDLLFTPVPRCRVLDTRVAGGRLTADIPRDFDVAGPLAGQGGASDCLVPEGATAVVVNLTVVHPSGPGTLTAWPFGGTMPAATLINFVGRARAGANAANEVILPICDASTAGCPRDFSVQAGGNDTHVVADVAGYFSKVAGLTVPWTAVTDKPAGFADDIDDDTRYTAGTGLALGGTEFSVNTSVIQSRVAQICPANSAMRIIAANGQVTCETDNDTTYLPGTGLLLAGTTFSVNSALVQSRVLLPCPPGSAIRVIDSAGAVTCETDSDTTYTAGAGLDLTGTTFSVGSQEITGAMLAAGAVGPGRIAANAVTAAEIAPGAVTGSELAFDAVGAVHIASGAVNSAGLANNSVLSQHILDSAVGAFEIATDAVGAPEIAANAVGTEEIAAGAVGRSEIDGSERAIYRPAAACRIGDILTTDTTCTTPLCTPVPVPIFWSCGNNCDSLIPATCNNTLLGYLLSPNIE